MWEFQVDVCVCVGGGCKKLEVSGPGVKDVNLIQPLPPPPAPFPFLIILSIMSSWKGGGGNPSQNHTHTHSLTNIQIHKLLYNAMYIHKHMYEFVKSLNRKV